MSGLYSGTLKGRLFVKQKIILPLVLAKKEDKLKPVITYLRDYYSDNPLITELVEILNNEKDQAKFLERIATLAIKQIVPFLNILSKIQDRFFGNP